jgi:hypothetical protein
MSSAVTVSSLPLLLPSYFFFRSLTDNNVDGSWGKKEKETATFLVLDALRIIDNP